MRVTPRQKPLKEASGREHSTMISHSVEISIAGGRADKKDVKKENSGWSLPYI